MKRRGRSRENLAPASRVRCKWAQQPTRLDVMAIALTDVFASWLNSTTNDQESSSIAVIYLIGSPVGPMLNQVKPI